MDDSETAARVANLKPGVHYRYGTRRPYRACPTDFRETFLRVGWGREIEEIYRANTVCIARWIEGTGGDELRDARSRASGSPPAPKRRSRLPTYAEAVATLEAGADLESLKNRRYTVRRPCIAPPDAKSRPAPAAADTGGRTRLVTEAQVIARAVATGATEAAALAWLCRPLVGYGEQTAADLITVGRGNLVLEAIASADASVFS